MPKYVSNALHQFQHLKPTKPQYSPHFHAPIKFDSKGTQKFAPNPDNTSLLGKDGIKFVQSVVGTFLYYARAIDLIMLTALNEISAPQAIPTEATRQKCLRLLDYAATYQNAFICYHASDMILNIDSDAAYLVIPKAKSRIAGFFFMNNLPSSTPLPVLNGAILVECKTLRHVVASRCRG